MKEGGYKKEAKEFTEGSQGSKEKEENKRKKITLMIQILQR